MSDHIGFSVCYITCSGLYTLLYLSTILGHTSGASSGASSPAWRSPVSERRRPPDMPVGVNIR